MGKSSDNQSTEQPKATMPLTDLELFKAFSFAWDAGYKHGVLRGRLQRSNRGKK